MIWKSVFDSFQCPQGVNPLLYFPSSLSITALMCARSQELGLDTELTRMSQTRVLTSMKKAKIFWQTRWVDKQQPICIPGNSMSTVPEKVIRY